MSESDTVDDFKSGLKSPYQSVLTVYHSLYSTSMQPIPQLLDTSV
jgi:hypothetical protein